MKVKNMRNIIYVWTYGERDLTRERSTKILAWHQAPQWGKKEKRGQIGKMSASEASPAAVWGGERVGGAWWHAFDAAAPWYRRFGYHALIGQKSSCWQIRGAVDSIVLFQCHDATIREKSF